jgi:hypothetical protein
MNTFNKSKNHRPQIMSNILYRCCMYIVVHATLFTPQILMGGDDNPCEETGSWSCGQAGVVESVIVNGDTEFTISVGESISAPSISVTTSDGNEVNDFTCPDTPGYGQSRSVSYSGNSWWEPEIPTEFEEPGTYTFTAKAQGNSSREISGYTSV